MRRADGDRSDCGWRGERLDESGQGTGAVRVITRQDLQDQVMDGCVTTCRVGKKWEVWRAEMDAKSWVSGPSILLTQNSRSLHESLRSVSVPALGEKKVIWKDIQMEHQRNQKDRETV